MESVTVASNNFVSKNLSSPSIFSSEKIPCWSENCLCSTQTYREKPLSSKVLLRQAWWNSLSRWNFLCQQLIWSDIVLEGIEKVNNVSLTVTRNSAGFSMSLLGHSVVSFCFLMESHDICWFLVFFLKSQILGAYFVFHF